MHTWTRCWLFIALVACGTESLTPPPQNPTRPEGTPQSGRAAPMSRSRYWHQATLLDSGWVLVSGGYGAQASEAYDPEGRIWADAGLLNEWRNLHTATLMKNGRVL